MNLNEIHFCPLITSKRQDPYVSPLALRKTHLIGINGDAAARAGATFHIAGNEAITSEGIGGSIPRFNIVSLRANTSAGRRCLGVDAALADPPVSRPAATPRPPPAKRQDSRHTRRRDLRANPISVWPGKWKSLLKRAAYAETTCKTAERTGFAEYAHDNGLKSTKGNA